MPPLPQPPYSFHFHPNPSPFPPITVSTLRSDNFSSNDKSLKVSPSILLIIIILAIVFFVSGLLHLLVRFLWRPQDRDTEDLDDVTALQGQLQQLFHLHDAGVDQSFIDTTLPVFLYKAIIGLKNPFDCAVCLCEFELEDKLRLLPKCSHAFHMECIDTWLLSHSTCPLCRANLLHDFNTNSNCSPIVLVLESGSDSSREIVPERDTVTATATAIGTDSVLGRTSSVISTNSVLGYRGDSEFGGDSASVENLLKLNVGVEKVVTVKLGKYRNVDGGGGGGEGSSSNNVDDRRCFSMGSFAYIMDETSSLQVPIRTPMKTKSSKKKTALPLIPGHRPAMSECDCESRRDFKFTSFDSSRGVVDDFAGIGKSRKESFSISKIWLRGKKDKTNGDAADSSRRTVSFRFPLQSNDDLKGKSLRFHARSAVSEMDFGGSEFGGYDEENQSCYSMDSSQARAPSFARRTLLWLTGKQNKVVHSSTASASTPTL